MCGEFCGSWISTVEYWFGVTADLRITDLCLKNNKFFKSIMKNSLPLPVNSFESWVHGSWIFCLIKPRLGLMWHKIKPLTYINKMVKSWAQFKNQWLTKEYWWLIDITMINDSQNSKFLVHFFKFIMITFNPALIQNLISYMWPLGRGTIYSSFLNTRVICF